MITQRSPDYESVLQSHNIIQILQQVHRAGDAERAAPLLSRQRAKRTKTANSFIVKADAMDISSGVIGHAYEERNSIQGNVKDLFEILDALIPTA